MLRHRSKPALLVLGAVALALYTGQLVSSQGRQGSRRTVMVDGHEAVEGEVLVSFDRAVPAAERARMDQEVDTEESEHLSGNTHRMRSRGLGVDTLMAYMRTRGDVVSVEPNYVLYALNTVPNDPGFGSLWGLLNNGQTVNGGIGTAAKDIHATAAWDISKGSAANVVAVIDTGIDYNHPDLLGNVWTAPVAFDVTIGGKLVHCAAGSHGFNAILNTCDPMDDNSHGTHVSGTIGARGNNLVGVTGVNWVASVMGSKFLDAAGSGTLANAINAMEFTIQAKQVLGSGANVRVLSNSWGGGGFSQLLLDEINKANTANMLFVAAAGNAGTNNDTVVSYPSSYSAPNVVAVAATDANDALASFSNYGAASVDLAAPGVNILSTTRNNTYAFYSGTSMATPHVSGAAALLLSVCPLDTAGVKSAILNNVDLAGSLAGRVLTSGRLNVDAAIRACVNTPPPPPPPPTVPAAPSITGVTAGNAQVVLTWTVPSGATSFTVKRGTVSGSYVTVASGAAASTYTDKAVTNGTKYYYVVAAVNAAGSSPNSVEVSATPAGVPTAPTGLTATSTVTRQVSLKWTASAGATSYIVKRSTSSGGSYSTVASKVPTTSYTDTGVSSGRKYNYVVIAVNAVGSSANSAQVNVTVK